MQQVRFRLLRALPGADTPTALGVKLYELPVSMSHCPKLPDALAQEAATDSASLHPGICQADHLQPLVAGFRSFIVDFHNCE
jgi:hypothetical protein